MIFLFHYLHPWPIWTCSNVYILQLTNLYRFSVMSTSGWGLVLYSLLKYDNTTCSTWVYLRAYVASFDLCSGIALVGVCGCKRIKLCFMGLSLTWCLWSHILRTWFGFGLCIRGLYTVVWCFPIGAIIYFSNSFI